MKSIYTYILEFRGGTYISQIESDDLKNSLPNWIDKITEDQDEIDQLGPKIIEEIKSQLLGTETDEEPILLKGLLNIWFLNISTKKGFGTIHIIKTEKV